eukprot:CCRYP_012087-RA/>CCRYP_012087-RA protein AED:0.02 eAED:0.01 QI:373/0.33/0.5/1/1/1/4/214/1413
MIRKKLAPRQLGGGDAVIVEGSSGGDDREQWHRPLGVLSRGRVACSCDDGEHGQMLNACISQLSNCCAHHGSEPHPTHRNHVTPDPAQNDSTADDAAASSFSIVDWINHNLPCVPGSPDQHVVSSPGEQQQQPSTQHQQSAQPRHEPLTPSSHQAAASCCHVTQSIPFPVAGPVTAPGTCQQMESSQKTRTERTKDRPTMTGQTDPNDHPRPTSSSNHAFNRNGNPSSSWLSGHLGLIQQNASSQLPLSNPPSLIKTASLTKPPSFNKIPSCPQSDPLPNQEQEATALASKPPRPQSPAIPPQPIVVKRTKSQIIASQFQKLGGSSRPNSRPNTPNNSTMAVHDGCSTITCLPNTHSFDGIDSHSSVGLNSLHGRAGGERKSGQVKHKKRTSDSSCVVAVDPLLFSCGNPHNFDGAMFHQATSYYDDDELRRTQSKLTVASQSTMDTGGTPTTHNTHTLHNILTRNGSSLAASSKTGTVSPERGNVDVSNAERRDRVETPKASNANSNTHVDGDAICKSESSISGNMPSQQPLLPNNVSEGYYPSALSNLMTWNKRSPSPLFGGTQVQLEKLLSKTSGKRNHCDSESGTIITDGASGVDASTRSKLGETSTFSSMSGTTLGEKRKVQWGVSTGGGSSKMPVLITAYEDSTEVMKRDSKTKTSFAPSVDIQSFAKYHEEIVTALIDGALQAKDNGVTSAKEPTPTTVTSAPEPSTSVSSAANAVTNSPRRSALTPIRKTPKSPHRSPFSTPIWKKKRSENKLDTISKVQKHERKISETSDSNIEKATSMFHFKTKQSAPLSPSSTTTPNKKPLDYFHPQCQLLKEKGSDKRKSPTDSKTASAIGKEAVLEKLQLAKLCNHCSNTVSLAQEKLSMLSDIESGKFGKAAEMLQSDAVAFCIESSADSINGGHQERHVRKGSNNLGSVLRRTGSNITQDNATDTIPASSFGTSKKRKAMVETRSLLTLRMGFVSMSYGILLQWDCASKLVELIVLRKMCREDFLERADEYSFDAPTVTKSSKPSTASASSTASGTTLESAESHSREPEGISRFFPQLLCEPDRRPESFLSVSVVSVKHIHTGCASCLASRQCVEEDATKSKSKRDTIRPYVRFVLGKNEHCTKPAKLLANGNLYYYKRHSNSCLLPMPREEFRWFAGQEDLIVEVRDMQSIATSGEGEKHLRKNKHVMNGKNTSKVSSKKENCSPHDTILAVVTVPLSSVNIEDDGNKVATSDDDESGGLSLWKHRKSKRNEFIGKDDRSSTNITLPLRMTNCSAASFGSISLQISIKAPHQKGASTSSVSAPSDSDSKAVNAKVDVDESIEIGAIARLMQGWAIYDAAAAAHGESDPVHPSGSSKSLRKKIRKQVPRWNKKWNPKTKKWSKLKLNNRNSSGRDPGSEEANWFTFMKWGDDLSNSQR